MHILFQCNELPPASCGGIGNFVAQAARSLVAKGHNVTVVGLYDERIDDKDSPFKVIRLKRIKRLGAIGLIINQVWFHLFISFYLTFVDRSIDLIEYPDYQGFGALHFHGIPFIVRSQSSGFHALGKYYGKPIYKLKYALEWSLQKKSMQRAKRLIISSRYAQHNIHKYLDTKNSVVIPNFVRREFIESDRINSNNIPKYILFYGTVSREKGVCLLIDAFNKLIAENDVSIQLKIVGRPNDDLVRRHFNGLPLNTRNRILFRGWVSTDRLISLIDSAEIVVFPSFRENMPMSWIEAMSRRKIIIGSNIPVAKEIITDGETGYLADLTIDNLCHNILRVLSLGRENKLLIEQNARAFAYEKYNIENIVNENISIWNSALC